MKKLTILFLGLLLALPVAMKATVTKEKKDDTRYLAGAVPEVGGKVVFSKEFQLPGKSQAEIYATMTRWMEERLKENKNDSRIVFSDPKAGTIAGLGEQWIVFSSSALSLDRTWINYQITATCQTGSVVVQIEKIRFTYRETEKYKAEEWITDKYALNKDKTKLIRGLAKWRRKTVDFADELFKEVATAFGINSGAIIAPATPAVTQVQQAPIQTPVVKAGGTLTDVDLKQIPGEVYALMGNGKLVISIGQDEFNMTNMTANAGGALGYQSGKAVAYCSLSPEQSYDIMEKADRYTLKLYAEGQTTPSVVIECRKLPAQTASQPGQPRTYVGEIVKLLMNK